MSGDFIFAFIVTPAIVILLGLVAMLLHERSLRRGNRSPAE